MIRRALNKRGLWVFILALFSFMAINHRLNRLEDNRQDQLAAAAEVFAAAPDSAGATRIIIQNTSGTSIPRLNLLIRAEKPLLEYQPALPQVSYTSKREGDSIILDIGQPKIESDKHSHLRYSDDVQIYIPAHLSDITLQGIRATLNFQQNVHLSDATITAKSSAVEIRDINVNLLNLRDIQPTDTKDDKSSITLSADRIMHLDASLSNTHVSIHNSDPQSINSIVMRSSSAATVSASPAILQKIMWEQASIPQTTGSQ